MRPLEQGKFESLWRNVEGKILGYFFRKGCPEEDAKDLAQETVMRACRNFHSLRGDFTPWVFGIARYVFIDYIKRRQKEFDGEFELEKVDTSPDPESRAISSSLLRQCLGELDQLDRHCLILHDLEGLNYKKIAEVLGISLSNAHYHVEKSRKFLRERFPDLVLNRGRR